MIIRTFCSVVLIMCLLLDTVNMAPSNDAPVQQGPCEGMECLHGVLMHNDDQQGEEHKAEDQYLRFKDVLETEKAMAGPRDAEEQLHGILMHGDSDTGNHHDMQKDMLPEQQKELGPNDLSEMIHKGMHGEEGHHGAHAWDEEKIDDGNKDILVGPNDMSDMIHKGMHGEGHDGSHAWDDKQAESDQPSGPNNDKLMHNVLMHGDENYVHNDDHKDKTGEDSAKNIGPENAAQYLHGVLMHNDAEPGTEHKHDTTDSHKSEESRGNVGPNNDLHGILMHGDSSPGHDHSKEDEEAAAGFDVFNDMSKLLEMELDEELMRIIDLKKILEKDRQEYADWILNNPQFMDETMMGSTRADVSDTILNDIEFMKKRYLADRNEQEEEEVKKEKDENPFTAEDALSVYNTEEHAEEGEDTRHDLELAGSTEPINARHKVKMALMKTKEE